MTSIKKYIQQHIYKYHRTTSLIVAIPVIMWTVSGILHPIMTSFKPNVKNQFLTATILDTSLIKIPLHIALQKNNIAAIQKCRVVKLSGQHYYQIQHTVNDSLTYINCADGNVLQQGDKKYTIALAQKYLGDEQINAGIDEATVNECCHRPTKVTSQVREKSITNETVLNIEAITTFDEEYKSINKILPVYKVSFKRNDGIRLYIEPKMDRMAFAVDNNRAAFTKFFAAFHSWDFLGNNRFKTFLLVLFSALACFTSLFGLYILIVTRKKKIVPTNTTQRTRKWHRRIAYIFFVTTLLSAFSGCYHAFAKFTPEQDRLAFYDKASFNTNELALNIDSILYNIDSSEKLTNLSIIKVNNKNLWQLNTINHEKKLSKKYINTSSGALEKNVEIEYAKQLATTFSGNKKEDITKSEIITKFDSEYGFINKRLPVIKVSFNKNDNERYYIETSTGRLALKIQDADLKEGYCFAFLHKHHFWDIFLGKEKGKLPRDISTIVAALGLLLLTILGLTLFIKMKMRTVKQNLVNSNFNKSEDTQKVKPNIST